MTTYYANHREQMREQNRSYERANRDKRAVYKANWYADNIDRIKMEKHTRVFCSSCGKTICAGWMTEHKKTRAHLANVQRSACREAGVNEFLTYEPNG